MSEFWKKDKPSNIEEAMSLLRFGCVLKDGFAHETQEQFIDQQRTERRMLNCADYLERENAALRAKLEEATKDAERLVYASHLVDQIGDIDLHEEASINASAFGRETANNDDYLAAFRTAIDAAIAQGEGEK